jgi:molecular chaperone DnaK
MTKDAAEHAAEDKQRRRVIEARNQLDSLIYQTEKLVGENKDKIPESDAKELTDSVAEGRKLVDSQSDDEEAIKSATERITKVSHALAEILYKNTPSGDQGPTDAGGGAAGEQAEEAKKDDVVDAEFTEENH